MSTTPPSSSRSVKIDQDERGGWSSDRPRREGGPPRKADVAVRGRALKPSALLRYSPGSLLLLTSGSKQARDDLAERVIEERGALLSLDKVRALLAARGVEDDEKAAQLLDTAVAKRLEAGQSVVLAAEGVDAEERERFVRMASPHRRPCHLILVEAPADQIGDESRKPLNALRSAIEAGELGTEGFHTFIRLGGPAIGELKRVVFRPPPEDD